MKKERLQAVSQGLAKAAQQIQERGWCKGKLREPHPSFLRSKPSRVCMMGAIQDSFANLPRQDRYLAYDIIHQMLDGVPIQDYNDSQSNPKPVIRKLLLAAKEIEDRIA